MSEFISVYTGNSPFLGDVWQIYKHQPDWETLGYVNYEPMKLYKTQEAADRKANELNNPGDINGA